MSKTRFTIIGGFVIAALVVGVAILTLLGGDKYLTNQVEYSMYFSKSVKGLNIGAPVMFRGVKIGAVTDIKMSTVRALNEIAEKDSSKNVELPIQVKISLSPECFGVTEYDWEYKLPVAVTSYFTDSPQANVKVFINELVENHGMRAQLQTSSFLTGQLYIELNLHPNEVASEDLMKKLKNDGELPIMLSTVQKISQSMEGKDIAKQIDSIYMMCDQMGEFVRQGKFQAVLTNIHDTTAELKAVSVKANNRFDSLADNSERLITDVRDFIKNFHEKTDQFFGENGPVLNSVLANLESSSKQLGETLEAAGTVLEQLQRLTAPNSSLENNVNKLLSDVDEMSVAIRSLVELLQRQPDAVLRGRQ